MIDVLLNDLKPALLGYLLKVVKLGGGVLVESRDPHVKHGPLH
ncbi:MAG: hypothetical protein ABR866_20710 [Candidatus Korobacteraceae bacterium]|jgi:hypothetical protein